MHVSPPPLFYPPRAPILAITGIAKRKGKRVQTGSNVTAAAGDINIAAQDVAIQEVQNTGISHSETKFEKSGLTLSLSNAVVDAANTVEQQRKAGTQTSSGRMKALAVANALMSGSNAVNSVMNGATGNLADKVGGVSVNVSVGGSTSESSSTQTYSKAQGSNVTAGGNINIVAASSSPLAGEGWGEGDVHDESVNDREGNKPKRGNITIQGSNIKAGKDTTLDADNDINLLAAKNTADQHSSNSSSSGSIGVGVSLSSKGGGLTATASASAARGNADGNDVTWTNTHVEAGNTLTLKSGHDTNMKGAIATGNQVVADISGNLNIASLQDTSVYGSQQTTRGGSLSVAIIGTGSGGSVNASDTNINSNYASVTEQSGIKAGDGGYKVKVKGNTDLKGAVIAASDEGLEKSTFKTGGTLTQSDIQNSASYNAEAIAVSAGVGDKASASAGMGQDSGNASSTTKSGIGVSTKTDTTGAIAKIFDANKVTEEVNAQVQITQTFSQLAPKAVGDYATTKLNEARDKLAAARDKSNGLSDTERAQLILDAQALDDNWGEGGAARVALHTVVGALGGGVNGALGAGTVAVSTPEVAKIIDGMDVSEPMRQALIMAAGTVIGEVAGGKAGAASGLTEVANNYLNHTKPDLMHLSEAERYAAAKEGCANHDDEACKVKANLESASINRDIQIIKDCNGGSADCSSRVIAATENGSKIGHDTNGKVLVASPEYAIYTDPGEIRAISDVRDGTFHQQSAESLNTGLIVTGTGLGISGGIGILYDMGVVAQTTLLTDGLSGISAGKWATTVLVSGGLSATFTLAIDPNATPDSLFVSGITGGFGGTTKLGLNAVAGLANQWFFTTAENAMTQGISKSFGTIAGMSINQAQDTHSGDSWFTTPVISCGPYPRKPC